MGEILAALVAMFAGLSIMPHYNALVSNNTQETIDANAATQFQTMITGANKYVGDHLETLTVSVPVGGAVTEIPFSTIVAANDVPSGFSATNVIGQTWHVYVRQQTSGEIQALVEGEGGQQLQPADMVKIAGLTGALGGYVPYNGMLGNLSSNEAVGTNWSLPLSGLPSPGAGRLVGNLVFGNADSTAIDTNSFLYRVGVPGHDNLNTMNVALNMAGNNINSVGTLNAGTANATNVNATTINAAQESLSNTLHVAGQLGVAGYQPGQAMPSGWNGISTMDTVVHGTLAAATDGNGTYNVQIGNSAHQGIVSASETISANVFRPTQIASAGDGCSSNSSIARDSSGNRLACVDGVWKAPGGGTPVSFYETEGYTYNYREPLQSDYHYGYNPTINLIEANPYTGNGSCPSGTVDRQVGYASMNVGNSDGQTGPVSGAFYNYWLHACTGN